MTGTSRVEQVRRPGMDVDSKHPREALQAYAFSMDFPMSCAKQVERRWKMIFEKDPNHCRMKASQSEYNKDVWEENKQDACSLRQVV